MRIHSLVIALLLSTTALGKVEKAKPKEAPPTPAKANSPLLDAKGTPLFAIPDFIRHDVDFWAKVYREWDTNQVVIYDSPTKIVYRVLNLPKLDFALSAQKYRKEVQAEVNRVQIALKQIAAGENPSESDDAVFAQIRDVVKQHDLLKETDLVERLRQQSGLRSQFEFGLKSSGRYADEMKAVLRSQSLPEELLAIVFVESLFNLSAQSHAGACGPWGILKETAINSGIHVNKFTDERIDPVVATVGASRYLKKAKDNLTEWPLAITAYNYGYPGMLRAVNNLGSKDFSVIVAKHDSPIFKYASKNYYAEFLAAVDTLHNQEQYFPGLKKDERWEYEVVQVQRPVLVNDIVSVSAVGRDDLAKLNPGLTRFTIDGSEVIPADYALRVPRGQSTKFYAQLKRVPTTKRNAAALKVSSKYQARGKESLNAIAKIFGISAEFLSERMGKPLDYKPKGPVLIRSQSHLFSPLLEINKTMLAAVPSGQALEKPPEIMRAPK